VTLAGSARRIRQDRDRRGGSTRKAQLDFVPGASVLSHEAAASCDMRQLSISFLSEWHQRMQWRKEKTAMRVLGLRRQRTPKEGSWQGAVISPLLSTIYHGNATASDDTAEAAIIDAGRMLSLPRTDCIA
jgi:hypothetical protein